MKSHYKYNDQSEIESIGKEFKQGDINLIILMTKIQLISLVKEAKESL